MGRRVAWAPAVALATCVAACTDDTPAPTPSTEDGGTTATIPMPTGDPLAWPVDAVGPFKVGHRTIDVSYRAPNATVDRAIQVDLWYPTLDAEGENTKYKGVFLDADVFEGARLAPPIDPKGYPVHVYSHGSFGFGGTASNMAHWFASHGWVYVAPNHAGNVLGDPLGKKPFAIHYLRSKDVTASLDALEKLAPSDPLAGKTRTKRVLMSGHSFGAFTAWASGGVTIDNAAVKAKCDAGEFTAPCTQEELAVFANGGLADPRIAALVPMAGGMSDWVADYDAANKPTLLMSASNDVSGAPIFDRVKALGLVWLDFDGGCHELFALGGCQTFDEALGWKLTSTWALAWGRRFILGDASERVTKILTNAEPLSPKIAFEQKGTLAPPAGDLP